jgi:hypothetical protein
VPDHENRPAAVKYLPRGMTQKALRLVFEVIPFFRAG